MPTAERAWLPRTRTQEKGNTSPGGVIVGSGRTSPSSSSFAYAPIPCSFPWLDKNSRLYIA
jgi:hypothetical protein